MVARMANYTITIDASVLLNYVDSIGEGVLETVRDGVQKTALAVQNKWQDAVMQAPGIWGPERKAYVQSITYRMTTYLSAVVETNLPLASEIENGRPAKDLKKMLDSSPKVRESKKGRYLIIPMRHNTPGNTAYAPAMPSSIYAQAKQLNQSLITGHGKRESGTGAYSLKTKQKYMVRSREYAWGGRLPAGLAPKKAEHHTTDIYAGMVRMNTGSALGKAKSSAYMTFRIMGEWQTGKWLVPAKPGLFIARGIAQTVEQQLKANMAL